MNYHIAVVAALLCVLLPLSKFRILSGAMRLSMPEEHDLR